MWDRNYKDYPKNGKFKKNQVESGKGIVGCEMHETFGWQDKIHEKPSKESNRKGFLSGLCDFFSRKK
ncbi:MAG: hypothetical protein CMO81_08750 [Waddliaceae bacterium]|nr:hypothetical protein [Waddliaceae bacterium]